MIAPPDLETAVVTVLDAGMSAAVATTVENPRPAGAYVRVGLAGGNARNLVQVDQRLLVECWDDDEQGAFDAAQLAWGLLWAKQNDYMGDVYVTAVDSQAPVRNPDPDTRSPRYQFLTTITASMTEVSV